MDPRIGFLTIGQAPRRDVVPSIMAALPGTVAVEAGALDGLCPEEVSSLAPRHDDLALVTMANGREVIVGKRAVTRGCKPMKRLEQEVDLFVVLCTGGFPPFVTAKPVLLPDRILKGAVAALWSEGPLGVIAPLHEQIAMNRALWAGYPLEIEVASPYDSPEVLDAAAANCATAARGSWS
jgi:protein AroM